MPMPHNSVVTQVWQCKGGVAHAHNELSRAQLERGHAKLDVPSTVLQGAPGVMYCSLLYSPFAAPATSQHQDWHFQQTAAGAFDRLETE